MTHNIKKMSRFQLIEIEINRNHHLANGQTSSFL